LVGSKREDKVHPHDTSVMRGSRNVRARYSRTMDDSLRRRARTARDAIVAGSLRGSALRELLLDVPYVDRDAFTDEMLQIDQPPDVPLPPGAVPYLPCGIDEILAMVRDAPVGPGDELIDLGSGLGRVAIMIHLLSGARTRGIEIQAPLVERSIELCDELGLRGVSFVQGDVAESDLEGAMFFLYAPFNGAMLARVMERLERVARRHPIVVGAVGLELDVTWLVQRETTHLALALYDGRVS
jgi:hypothetical protein